MEDERIIELFFERSEEAVKELDMKYGKICRSPFLYAKNEPSL